MVAQLIRSIESEQFKSDIPTFGPGDTVRVHAKVVEGTRERIQEFKGTVLFTKNNGTSSSFTIRRVATNGVGVERTFLTRSPRIDRVVVERHSKVRRARLFFLRERTGKSARIKQRF